MNLDDLLNEMSEKMRNRDLSDEYLREHNNSTREEIGIGEYAYGITMIPCEWIYKYLSDYKRVLKENEIYKKNSEIMSKENLSTAEQLKVEIKENFRLKNQLENNRKEYQETYKDVREELRELKKENEELTISNKEIDKECSRLEKKEVELINENEHYKDLIYALKTYYNITEEDLEECMKNDR